MGVFRWSGLIFCKGGARSEGDTQAQNASSAGQDKGDKQTLQPFGKYDIKTVGSVPSGLYGWRLPATRPSGLPVLRPSGLGRIAGPLPGYGPVPQVRSAGPSRTVALDFPVFRNVPRVAAPLARATCHGLGDLHPHDRTIQAPYIYSLLNGPCCSARRGTRNRAIQSDLAAFSWRVCPRPHA